MAARGIVSVLLAAWCAACAGSDSGSAETPDASSGSVRDAGPEPYDPKTTPTPRYVGGAMLARGGGAFGLIQWARAADDGGIYVSGTMERAVTVLSTASGAPEELPGTHGYFLLRLDASLRSEWSFGFGSSAQADFRYFRPPAVLPDGSVVLLRNHTVQPTSHTLARVSAEGSVVWSVPGPDVGYAAFAATSAGDFLSLGDHSPESDLDPGSGTRFPPAAGVHVARFSGETGSLEQLEILSEPGFHGPLGIIVSANDFPVLSVQSENGATGWLARLDARLSLGAPGTWVQSFHRGPIAWSLRGDDSVWVLNSTVMPADDAPPGPPSLVSLSSGRVTATAPFEPVTEVWGAAPAGDDVMVRADYSQPGPLYLQTKQPPGSFVAALAPDGGYRWLVSMQGRASIVNEFLAVGTRLLVFGNAGLQAGEAIDLDPGEGVDEFVADAMDRYFYVLEFEVPR